MPHRERFPPRRSRRNAVVQAEASVPYPLLAACWLGPPPTMPDYEDTRIAIGYVSGALDYRTTHLSKVITGSSTEAWGGRLAGMYVLVVQGEHGATFDVIRDEVKHALWTVSNYSPSYWNIATPRSRAIGRVILGLEDLADRSENTANGLESWGTPSYAQPMIDNALTLTSVSVQGAVETIFKADRAAWVWIEPNAGAPPSGRVIR
jgi:hypothetical protein